MPPRLTFLINCFDNSTLFVINGDRRLIVREVADKCGISKTTAHQILGNDLNMNRVCARWVPRILTAEHLTKRVELSKQFIKKVNRGGIKLLDSFPVHKENKHILSQ
jgi:DNA-binding Xre family transcriptional regulator